VLVILTCSARHQGAEEWYFTKLIKVIFLAETAYPVYIGCDVLRNEFSKEFLEDHFSDQGYCEGQEGFADTKHPAALMVNIGIVCFDTGGVRGVRVDDRITEDAHGVRINIGEAYSGKEIWEPKVTRLSCVDAADNATSIVQFVETRGTNGHHADV
jgi:hypothetical protein